MPANLENSAVATGLEKVHFHSNPKERQCQRMFKLLHNCTHLTLANKLPTSVGSSKKQESSRKTSTSALLTMPKPLCGSQQTAENSSRDCNTRAPYLPPEKSVSRSRSIETCIISYMKQITSPGSMHDTGCLGLVH